MWEGACRVLPVLHPGDPLLCMDSWATSFILLDPSNDSQVKTCLILSRQTQTMSTGPLLLREESEHLQTQHVKNRATLVLSHCHLQYHAVPYPPRQLSPLWGLSPLVCLTSPQQPGWLSHASSTYLLNPQLSQFRLWNSSLKSNC